MKEENKDLQGSGEPDTARDTSEEMDKTAEANGADASEDSQSEQETRDTSEKTVQKNITPEATFDSPNGKDVHRPIVFVELALAIIALVFIIVAIVSNRKKADTADPAISADGAGTLSSGVASADMVNPPAAEIDNSAVTELAPAVPDAMALNTLTAEECEKRVADGTMLKLETADGAPVYVANYKNEDLLRESLTLTDADVDEYIRTTLLEVSTVPLPADHDTAQMGDIANIDFVGTLDGVAFEGGTGSSYDLELGSGSFVPGFEEGVVGMKIGEIKDIPLTFPENYYEELAGKDVVFKVTLNALKTPGYADELTDDIASYVTEGDFATAAELKEYLKTDYLPIEKMNDLLFNNLYISDLSKEEIQAYYDEQINSYLEYSNMYGVSLEQFMTMQGAPSLQEVLNMTMDEAALQARADRLYSAVLENDLAPITDSDITQLAANYGYSENVESFIETYGHDYLLQYLRRDKATAYLQSFADKALETNTSVSDDTVSGDIVSENETAEEAASQNNAENAQ
ncbi:MAG: FKBP-type peptidyl-prolyl cis-trans isomerase [Lachnospiraceae bacterium]|nr:FKBP-type peptidyl-prolyl cis-trans isomerase [Lachnospiraceae bacterium]